MGLLLYDSLLSRPALDAPFDTANFYMDLTQHINDWKRNIKRQGGLWQGSFSMHSDAPDDTVDVDRNTLINLFYNALGWHVEEHTAGVLTWEGYISELYLKTGNTEMVLSYNGLVNHIVAKDSNGDIVADMMDEESVLRYGLIEEEITIQSVTNQTASQQVENYLRCHAWPRPKPVSRIDPTPHVELQVRVNGYIHTAAWRLMDLDILSSYRATIGCDDFIEYVKNYCGQIGFDPEIYMAITAPYNWIIQYVLDNYCDYLTPGNIQHNGLYKRGKLEGSPLDVFMDLADDGGAFVNGVKRPFWRLFAEIGREVHFEPIETNQPDYLLNDSGEWRDIANNQVSDFWARPATLEDTTFPVDTQMPGCVFPRNTVFYADEVSVSVDGDWNSKLSWRTAALEEAYLEDAHQMGVP